MIRCEFFIPGPLPGLNELIDARMRRKGKWNAYSDLKRQWEGIIGAVARVADVPEFPSTVQIWYEFHEPTTRRDPSNVVAGGIKLIEDALVKLGRLKGDGWKVMKAFYPTWRHSKDRPGVRVTILGDEA